MHKGIRQLTSDTIGGLTYDQAGFDLLIMDHNQYNGRDYKIFRAGPGTDTGPAVYKDIPADKVAHWIGIHNCGTVHLETCSVQAGSVVGDDFAKDGTFDSDTLANYIELKPGEIIYGKFTQVSLVKTSSGSPIAYVDVLRLIRGV